MSSENTAGGEPLGSGSSATRRVARNTMFLVLSDASTKLALFVLYALIARTLGTRGFGNYTLAISLAFFVSASSLGIDVILSREIARDIASLHGLFWETVTLKLAAGLPILALVVIGAAIGGNSATVVAAVALIGASNLIDVVAQSPHAVFRGVEDMGPPARALALESVALVVLAGLALVVLHGKLIALGVANVIAAVIALAYIWIVLRRRRHDPRRQGDTYGLGWLLRAAIPTGITSLFGYALGRIDAVILTVMSHHRSTVGLYGAAYRVFEATLFVSWATSLAVYPILSRLPAHTPSLRRAFELSCMATAALTVPLGAAMTFFGPTIARIIFGASYNGAGAATEILGGAAALYGLFTIAAMTLAAQDRQRSFPAITAAALALNVALNVALIPSLSLRGAAWAMTAAQAFLTLAMLGGVWRLTDGFSPVRILAGPACGVSAMALIALLIGRGGVGLAAGVGGYVLAFIATEWGSHRTDLDSFVRAVARRGGASSA